MSVTDENLSVTEDGKAHIAFLVALVVVAPSLRAVLPIITAFTAAHSITLLLAALRVVSLDSRLVDSAIAVSICYVAVENLFRRKATRRWLVAFCFASLESPSFWTFSSRLRISCLNSSLLPNSFWMARICSFR